MSEAPGAPDRADYEYDAAHDDVRVPPPRPGEPLAAPVRVDPRTDETGGDYGYDLAHGGG